MQELPLSTERGVDVGEAVVPGLLQVALNVNYEGQMTIKTAAYLFTCKMPYIKLYRHAQFSEPIL